MTLNNIYKYNKELRYKHLGIVLSVFLILCSFTLLHVMIAKEKDGYSKLINISGRQRMLSQRLLLHVVQNEDEKLFQKDLKLFKESHKQLANSTDKNINNYYKNNLNNDVKLFYEILSNNDVSSTSTYFVKNDLLKKLNEAVSLFEKKSD